MEQKNPLETGKIGKLLFQLALPSITAQIINVLYNMVDRMFIGHIAGTGASDAVKIFSGRENASGRKNTGNCGNGDGGHGHPVAVKTK